MNKRTILALTLIPLLLGGTALAAVRALDSGPGKTPALAAGEKSLFVPATARRTTDARGNSLIRLPDSRQIRLLKNGQVEILNRAGQVTERGQQFVRWVSPVGMRAGPAGMRAGPAGKRASPLAPAGQYLIYR